MLEVVKAEHVEAYKLRVQFNDGKCGLVDLADSLWGPVFEPLRDLDRFKRFMVSSSLHTVCWENGADFAPEHLRQKMLRH